MGPRSNNQAPGHPGIPARWTSSAKSGVGTAPPVVSRVWFTLSHSILDEIYYPRVDYACTRDSASSSPIGLWLLAPCCMRCNATVRATA
jgi:hypothetical protein